MICGFSHVPSLSTFSRRLDLYAKNDLLNTLFDDIIRTYLSNKLIGYISRDSTAISAREKAINTKSEVKEEPKKRGRPRKGEIRPEKEPSVLERQIHQSSDKFLSDINKQCAWGAKKNSQGNMSYWKGYKIHLDVMDFGIPVTVIITGANVHDSQLAIPMERITSKKITYLYSLMDAAYDAEQIISVVKEGNHVPLIDQNKRRKQARPSFTDCEKNDTQLELPLNG